MKDGDDNDDDDQEDQALDFGCLSFVIQKGNGNGDDGEVLDENKDFKLSCLFSFAFCSCVAGSISFCPQPKAMARVSSLLNSLFISPFKIANTLIWF